MIDARPDELEEISRILQEHVPEFEVRAYGSRAKWTSWDYSDLDLVVVAPTKLDFTTLVNLRSAFEESELRFSVDVMDWHAIPESFRQEIDREYVTLQVTNTEPSDVDLVQFTPLSYGKALKKTRRNPSGSIPVYGSNGIIGYHDQALTTGPTVVVGRKGSVGVVNFSPGPCWPIDTTFYHEESDSEIARFKYLTLSRLGLDQMNSDSAVPGLNRNNAHALQVRVPSIEDQRRIAGILGTLDDKIELNRRMSQTLEEMAQALFKSWFVDFDPVKAKSEGRPTGLPPHMDTLFPDSFTDSPLGPIPTGWKLSPLVESCSLIMGQSPRSEYYNELGEGLPFHQGVSNFGNRFPTHRRWTTVDKRLAEPGDILFSVRAPVGRINLALDHLVVGRGLSAIRALDGLQNFLHSQLKEMFSLEDSIGSGTIYKAVTKRDLESIKLLKPSSPAVKEFESVVAPIANLIAELFKMNCDLREARDLLLPRLISRELDMPKLKSGCFGASA